jgi:hypothetical protein
MSPRMFTLLLLLSLPLHAAPPKPPPAMRANPPAAAIGKTTRITFTGPGAADATGLWTPINLNFTRIPSDQSRASVFDIQIPAENKAGLIPLRLTGPKGISGLMMLMLDDLPAVPKHPGNNSLAHAQRIEFPSAVDGACEEMAFDYYRFAGKKGQRIWVDVVAGRIGSSLDAIVRLLDSAGHELAYCDDDPATAPDPRFAFVLPANGDYILEIRDVNYDGGTIFHYRLRLGDSSIMPPVLPDKHQEIEPNDSPSTASPLSIPGTISGRFDRVGDVDHFRFSAAKGEKIDFRSRTRSLNSPCDAVLQICKIDGTVLARSKPSDPAEGSVEYDFVEPGEYVLRVAELSGAGGQGLLYQIIAGPALPPFTLSIESENLAAKPAGHVTVKVTATRAKEYKAAIALSAVCPDLSLAAMAGTIPEGKTEGQLTFDLPADAEAGTLHVLRILGRPVAKPNSNPAIAATTAALKKNFPRLLYPAPDFDGTAALWVLSPPQATQPR